MKLNLSKKKIVVFVFVILLLGCRFIGSKIVEKREYLLYEWFRNRNHKNGTLLAIGNSLTAAKYWQYEAGSLLDMTVKNHCKGGIGVVTMVDGDDLNDAKDADKQTFAENHLDSLRVDEVRDVHVIVLLPAYNERGTEYGQITDMYNPKTKMPNTINAKMNYAINRIKELLKEANNKSYHFFIVTPHCAGKYPYIDADGYDEYPVGSGRNMETLTKILIENAKFNNVYFIDAFHNSGIDSTNWNKYQSSEQCIEFKYIGNNKEHKNNGYNEPFENEKKLPLSKPKGILATVKDTSSLGYSVYCYDGTTWIKQIGIGNYPWNADQLHLNKEGYKKLGRYIAKQINSTLQINK
ncbi:MAG TPA: hypothetical protein VIH57_23185 [Bacteroidales bacterium]